MQTLPKAEVLTARRERELAIAIEAGVLAGAALVGDGPATRGAAAARGDAATTEELTALARIGRQAEREFLMANLRLVKMVSLRPQVSGALSEDDLFQEGWLGLAEAVRRWDHRRGVRFATYALPWIRARVAEAIRRHHPVRMLGRGTPAQRQLRAVALDEAVHAVAVQGRARPDDFDEAERSTVPWDRLRGAVTDEQWAVLRLRYGMAGPCRSYVEIAAELGMSRSTVRRVEQRALSALRLALLRCGIDPAAVRSSAA